MSETTAVAVAEEQMPSETVGSSVVNVWNDKDAFDQMARKAAMLSRSTLLPAAYQGKTEDCFLIAEIAARLNWPPTMVAQSLYMVKGRPSWSGQACMSIIQGCGKFASVDLEYVGEEGTDKWGAYVTAVRVSDGKVVNGPKVTIAMAKAEGWMNNPKWKNMPELMMGYRAAAFFARLYCPDVMMGFMTSDEVEDIQPKPKTTAQRLADALKVETPATEQPKSKSVADALRESMQ